MFKTDKKTRNYIISLLRYKMPDSSEKIEYAKMSYYSLRRTN